LFLMGPKRFRLKPVQPLRQKKKEKQPRALKPKAKVSGVEGKPVAKTGKPLLKENGIERFKKGYRVALRTKPGSLQGEIIRMLIENPKRSNLEIVNELSKRAPIEITASYAAFVQSTRKQAVAAHIIPEESLQFSQGAGFSQPITMEMKRTSRASAIRKEIKSVEDAITIKKGAREYNEQKLAGKNPTAEFRLRDLGADIIILETKLRRKKNELSKVLKKLEKTGNP